MKKVNKNGFTSTHILLFLVLVGIIGFTGWKVYSTGQTSKTAESSTPTPAAKKERSKSTPTIPDGFVAYENKEMGLKFAYPKDWGDASLQSGGRYGYSNFSNVKTTEPDGAPAATIVFSKSSVSITSKSTKYMYGPKGGTSLSTATGFCIANGKYYHEYQNYKNYPGGYEADGVNCTDYELKGVEVISSNSIYIADYEEVGEGDSSHETLGIFRVNNKEFPGWLIIDRDKVKNESLKKVLKSVSQI